MIKEKIIELTKQKKVLILGFGREGQSTYRYLRSIFPTKELTIADLNPSIVKKSQQLGLDNHVDLQLGKNYLEGINDFDIVFKTPGISLKNYQVDTAKLTSQSDIMLSVYAGQIIGITGTKGKSTTASLLYNIFKAQGDDVVLTGNIGIPAFDAIGQISHDTKIVYELSSHQLEYVKHSPHIAILLNFFQEHLDHYNSYKLYQEAKMKIAAWQGENDYFIFNSDDPIIKAYLGGIIAQNIPFSRQKTLGNGCFYEDNFLIYKDIERKIEEKIRLKPAIKGQHNLGNILAACSAAMLTNTSPKVIQQTVEYFQGLEHRLEYIGQYQGIYYYNDSIATIPEATMAALQALKDIDTIILGGYDRGVDYSTLADFIVKASVKNCIFLGRAGERMRTEIDAKTKTKKLVIAKDLAEAIIFAKQLTHKGKGCLLSPAAASYDMFRDFIERGKKFKSLVKM